MNQRIDVGVRFGRLTVTSRAGLTNNGRNTTWNCRCDCGGERVVSSGNLRVQRSCGCLSVELVKERRTSHAATIDGSRSAEYDCWSGMLRRCYEQTNSGFKNYGAAGISVCDRWRLGEPGKHPFSCFLEDMGQRPTPGHSIDRFPDNRGNYEPGNCRWATAIEQQRNRTNNRLIEIDGDIIPLSAAAERSGIHEGAVSARLRRGWSVEASLTTPSRARNPKPPSIRNRKK